MRLLSKPKNFISASGLTPKYLWDASSERIKFWMLNTIYPRNSKGEGLYRVVKRQSKANKSIIHFGCGKNGEAILDLYKLGYRNLIGIDFEVPRHSPPGVEFIQLDLTRELPIAAHSVTGLVFGSYLLRYMPPALQLQLLLSIDRITGRGADGFLGPFYPQHLINTTFSEHFKNYQNPLYGFVNTRRNEKSQWALHRSRIATFGFLQKPVNHKQRRGFRLPLFSFYDMTMRSATARLLGNAEVKRDYKPIVPNEYFITFSKSY
jgi:hypothetical protein